ncbi:MAG: response regulator [Candidatus Riflebacteria bacterium]|nr:response regulator [Candidatus Riflebacteria bacterium]
MVHRLLLVEDSRTDREALLKCIKTDPPIYEVVAAASIEEAFDALAGPPFDLILLDHYLPGCTGLQLLESIRAKGIVSPVIYITGELGHETISAALSLGATHYLAKDGSHLKVLAPVVRRSLELEQVRRDREQAVALLRQAEATHRSLVESADALMFQLTRELRVLFVNQAVRRHLGYPPEELMAGPGAIERILLPADRAPTLSACRAMFDTRETHELEAHFLSRRGGVRLYRLSSHLREHEGLETVLEVIATDITAQRALMEALENEKSELTRANIELSKLSRVRADFLQKISHELCTPMNSILGYTEYLLQGLDGPLAPRQTENLERVRRNAQRLMGFISNLLDFSRLEAREIELSATEFPLVRLLAEVVEPYGSRLRPGAELVMDCPADLVVRAEAGVEVEVKDAGPGIPSESLGVIFEPFRQASEGLDRGHEGAGLGLAIADQLARLHHGYIEVESLVGAGSTFRLKLPIQPQGESRVPPFFGVEGGGARSWRMVLAVDRDPETLALLARILEPVGFQLLGVRSVGHALSILARISPRGEPPRPAAGSDPAPAPGSGPVAPVLELAKAPTDTAPRGAPGPGSWGVHLQTAGTLPCALLVDLVTAEADGAPLFGRLREAGSRLSIPVLTVSLAGERPLLADAARLEWLEKPFKPAQLLSRIHQLISLVKVRDCLVVDDEADILSLYDAILKNEGVPQIRRASSAEAALAEIERHLPDVMILDLRMPGMGGLELIRQLRTHDRTRNLPIVVVTGKSLTQEDSLFLSKHVSHVLMKGESPNLEKELVRLLNDAVGA